MSNECLNCGYDGDDWEYEQPDGPNGPTRLVCPDCENDVIDSIIDQFAANPAD